MTVRADARPPEQEQAHIKQENRPIIRKTPPFFYPFYWHVDREKAILEAWYVLFIPIADCLFIIQ